ncbi:MAG: AlpA family phage regulatory protein [Thiothrix sp.]
MTATTQPGAPARNPSAHLPQFPVYPTTDQPDQAQPAIDRFIRLPEVLQITGLSKSVLYENIRIGVFPDPYRISKHCSGWKYSEVLAWVESRQRIGGAA